MGFGRLPIDIHLEASLSSSGLMMWGPSGAHEAVSLNTRAGQRRPARPARQAGLACLANLTGLAGHDSVRLHVRSNSTVSFATPYQRRDQSYFTLPDLTATTTTTLPYLTLRYLTLPYHHHHHFPRTTVNTEPTSEDPPMLVSCRKASDRQIYFNRILLCPVDGQTYRRTNLAKP